MKYVLPFIAACFCALAQTPGQPFTLLRVVRTSPAGAIARANVRGTIDIVGLRAVTGPSETWFLEGHGSFASVEALDKAFADVRALEDPSFPASTALLAVYRHGLSYRPEEAFKLLSSARYFQMSIFRVRPGAEFDFAELMRIRKLGLDSINLDRPEIGYQIVSGGESGTYLFLSPLPSLAVMDNALAKMPVYAEGLAHAGAKAGRQIAADADVRRESALLRVDARISSVTDQFAAGDPAFWRPER